MTGDFAHISDICPNKEPAQKRDGIPWLSYPHFQLSGTLVG
jgi:hypothetical protein